VPILMVLAGLITTVASNGLTQRNAAGANHASAAMYSVADNRIASVGPAELRRQRISHASSGRRAKDAVDRVVELVRGSNPASPGGGPKMQGAKKPLSKDLFAPLRPCGED